VVDARLGLRDHDAESLRHYLKRGWHVADHLPVQSYQHAIGGAHLDCCAVDEFELAPQPDVLEVGSRI
jgi:hypothetical protein